MLSNQTLSSFFVFYGTAALFLEIIYSLVTSAKREAISFLFGCSEVNSTWLITSELANQRARKTLFTCVVYTNVVYILCLSTCDAIEKITIPILYNIGYQKYPEYSRGRVVYNRLREPGFWFPAFRTRKVDMCLQLAIHVTKMCF